MAKHWQRRTSAPPATERLVSQDADLPDYFENPPPRRFGVLAFLERNGQIAIISRSYWTEVSRWGLPGGSASPNENPRRAMSRILAEKLGLRIQLGQLIGIDYAPAWPGRYPEGLNLIYHVPVPDGVEPVANGQCGYADVNWVSPETVGERAIDHELWRIRQCDRAFREGRCADLMIGIPFPQK